MDWITRQIAISECPTDRTEWSQVDAILNLDRQLTYSPARECHHVPLVDGRGNDATDVAHAVQELDRLCFQGKRVLVHCLSGVSRSPYVVALYLSWRGGLFFEDALELVARRRTPELNIDPGLLAQKDAVLHVLNLSGQQTLRRHA
ncbi:MAG: dual specificity protein phosphatase family protein [Chloroflexi bacterium]|nr:dual specificity protein phosphatase family protein [Chloroflexota bacterium]